MHREAAEKTAESQRKPRHDSTIQWQGATGGPQHPILRMQQLTGNRAVGRALQAQKLLLSEPGASPSRFGAAGTLRRKCASCDENNTAKLQAKLLIGSSLDPEELEAERIADLAMQAPVAAEDLHTGCTQCAQHPGQPPFGRVTPLVQRRTSGRDGLRAAPSSVDQALQQPGQPLEPMLRDDMAARLGFDFSKVRIHSGAMADASAREVNARAYTVGHHIVFGAAQFAPSTRQGMHLLAHELTHVVQQTAGQGASIVARQAVPTQASCERGHQPGGLVKTSGKVEPETIIYNIWGTWQSGDTLASWDRRTFSDWIRWRFAGITAQQSNRVLALMLRGVVPEPDPPIAVPGCQYSTAVSAGGLAKIRQLSGEVRREQEAAKQKAEANNTEIAPADGPVGTIAKDGDGDGADAKPADEKNTDPGGTRAETKSQPEDKDKAPGEQRGIGVQLDGKTSDIKFRSTRVQADQALLKDPKVASLLLKILEHFTGRVITDEDRKAAADGLDATEVETLIGEKTFRRALIAFFEQGYAEFIAAGGTDIDRFALLEQTIYEQLTWGNPTATHNQLMIGKGYPEKNVLGIVDRGSGMLYYDATGMALPGISGIGFRDKGYLATKPTFGLINLGNIKDDGLRIFLNALRQSFKEPAALAVAGADVYFHNITLVNDKVVNGLSEVVKEKFLDTLPMFIGFLAGHAVVAFLSKIPEPPVLAVAAALQLLLTAAEYVMEIDFAAGAVERLMLAAAHLSHFEKNDKDELTALSEAHLDAAAKVIQDIVADIVAMFATMALAGLIRAAHKGSIRLEMDCTICDLDGPGTKEAKAEAGKAKGEGPKGEAKTPESLAREKLAELAKQKAEKQTELQNLRNLTTEYNEAVEATGRAAKNEREARDPEEWKKFRDEGIRQRDKARAAFAERALHDEQGISMDISDIDADIEVESIKADPNSRAALPCFAADTLILTPFGARRIAELAAGDHVWAYEFATGTPQARRVLQLHHGHTHRFHRIRTENGTVLATSQHRFWVDSDAQWRIAQSLGSGMRLRDFEARLPAVLENTSEPHQDADTYNLSIEEYPTYFVGPGLLVHNAAVDIGLGGPFLIYRATNPAEPGKVYIGQTTEFDVQGAPRGHEERQSEHRATAEQQLRLNEQGLKKLIARDKVFYEFMRNATLQPIVKGIATREQTDYLEQLNINLERTVSGERNVVNRRNQITDEAHMRKVKAKIMADPKVKAKGYCP